jgi:hypothetical protein
MTATPRSPRPSWAMTAIRRTLRGIRSIHEELDRASEALFRPVGAPRPNSTAGASASKTSVPEVKSASVESPRTPGSSEGTKSAA